jgi:hypothetical protein
MVIMERSDPIIHSFVIKVWLEVTGPDDEPHAHGYITHIPGGERTYLKDLDEIGPFIRLLLGRAAFTAER